MENLSLCLTILITGFVVVFTVLILLIVIIKIYGTVVTKALSYAETKKAQKQKVLQDAKKSETDTADIKTKHTQTERTEQGISPEIVAVIAAAVDSTLGEGKAKITGIKRSKTPNSRPAWGMAGVFENTKPF